VEEVVLDICCSEEGEDADSGKVGCTCSIVVYV
jgi:hypothetical protein